MIAGAEVLAGGLVTAWGLGGVLVAVLVVRALVAGADRRRVVLGEVQALLLRQPGAHRGRHIQGSGGVVEEVDVGGGVDGTAGVALSSEVGANGR